MNKTEAAYIPHCDDPNCTLGYLAYTCPNCEYEGNDFSFDVDEVTINNYHFECENCEVKLKVLFDDAYDFVVEIV